MTEYKIVTRKIFAKDSSFQEVINMEARNGWRVTSVGYSAGGEISKAVLERSNNNHQ